MHKRRFFVLSDALQKQLRFPIMWSLLLLDERDTEGLCRFLGRRLAAGEGRASTANVLSAIYLRLHKGDAILNVSELAQETGFSRPVVYRAIQYVASPKRGEPKLVRVHSARTGPRRPGWWTIRPSLMPDKSELQQIQKSQDQGLCALSVNPPKDYPRESNNPEPQAAAAASEGMLKSSPGGLRPLSTPAQATNPSDLLSWIESPELNLDREPSFGEKRKMAAALRLSAASQRIVDPVLDVLFRRKSLRLRVWAQVVRSLLESGQRFVPPPPPKSRFPDANGFCLIFEPPPPRHWSRQDQHELQWRARVAVRHLTQHPYAEDTFLGILELDPPLTSGATVREIVSIDRKIAGSRSDLANLVARARRQDGICPQCQRPVRLGPDGRVFDNYRMLSPNPDHVGGIWETRLGPHKCHEALLRAIASLQARRRELLGDPTTKPVTLSENESQMIDRVGLAKRRVRGIDLALKQLKRRPYWNQRKIEWLTAKREWLTNQYQLVQQAGTVE